MPPPTVKKKFSEVINDFTEYRKLYVKETTLYRFYTYSFGRFLKIVGDKFLDEYTNADLIHFLNSQTKLSPSSLNTQLRALKALARFCVENDFLTDKNVFVRFKKLKEVPKEPKFLTKEEFQLILKAEKNPDCRDIYEFAVLTGIRLKQLLNLKHNQLNFEQGTITLDAGFSKNGRISVIPLHPLAAELINRRPRRNELLFPRPHSRKPKVYSPSWVSHQFKRAARKAKLSEFYFHSLRKSMGSWLIASGASVFAVSKILCHSSIQVTERHYLGIARSQLQEEILKLNLTN